jgi:hypothetical protein
VTFGITRGEIILIAFIFALVYGAGLLPKLAARLSAPPRGRDVPPEQGKPEGE